MPFDSNASARAFEPLLHDTTIAQYVAGATKRIQDYMGYKGARRSARFVGLKEHRCLRLLLQFVILAIDSPPSAEAAVNLSTAIT